MYGIDKAMNKFKKITTGDVYPKTNTEIIVLEQEKCRCYFAHTDDDMLEFCTLNDEDVCDECRALDGKLFTKEENEGVIPVH